MTPTIAIAAPTEPLTLANPLVPAGDCEYCHSHRNLQTATDDPLYAPYFSWRGSMMANAARDPVFWAAVAIASQDAEDPRETESCIRCHSPRAFLEGRGDAIAMAELTHLDLEGVECEFCHRMTNESVIGNGQYAIDDVLVGTNVTRRGPWAYDGTDGVPTPEHTAQFDTFMSDSQMCGTCHDVTTDRARLDDAGRAMGTGFNEQRTYSEWAGSAFASAGDDFRSCQDCHMPAVEDVPGCRENAGFYSHATGGRRHDMVGANRFVVQQLAAQGSFLTASAFRHTLERMDAFIQTAATMEVTAPESVDLSQGLTDLGVRVTNETGHKLPTGYSEGRIMWLEVIASLGDDVVWSSGVWDQASGLFTMGPQLRTYEAIAQQQASGQTMHLLLNDHWVRDTRIPPRGLRPNPETDPVTDRYALSDEGTWPNFDEHTYTFEGTDMSAQDGASLDVRVRLLYIINTPQYIDLLAEDNATNQAGNEVLTMFDRAGGAEPLVLATQELSIPVLATPNATTETEGDGSSTTDTTTGAMESTSTPLPHDLTTSGEVGTSGPDLNGADDGCACRGGGPPKPMSTLLMVALGAGFGIRRSRRRVQR